MPELVLYGIGLVAKQLLGRVLDMEVDHWTSLAVCCKSGHFLTLVQLWSGEQWQWPPGPGRTRRVSCSNLGSKYFSSLSFVLFIKS